MLSRVKAGSTSSSSRPFLQYVLPKIGFLLPPLWLVLLFLAPPFFVISAGYLETLERSGPVAAFVADTGLSAMIFGYLILVLLLRQRRA